MIDPTFGATVQTPSVQSPDSPPSGPPPPRTPVPNASGPQTFEEYVNGMLSQKLATAIVKKQKMQYSILNIGQFHDGWWICEVENLAGHLAGDDLLIVIAKSTPIMLYPAGAVSAPAFTVQ
jgi:hypothetical protein